MSLRIMPVDEYPDIDSNEDLTQILPIQQKRTIAFVNHFVMNTVSLLNKFAQSCESRFMEFEYKIQKIEASLLILESQLSSISGLENLDNKSVQNFDSPTNKIPTELDLPDVTNKSDEKTPEEKENIVIQSTADTQQGVKAKDDPRFAKFFKMIQFGVPAPAVKLKMQNEGIDPSILEKPDDVLLGLTEDLMKSNSDEKSD